MKNNKESVENILKKINFKYFLEEDDGITVFKAGMRLDSEAKISRIKFDIFVTSRNILVISGADIKADTKNIARMAEYICRANYGLEDGNFEFDCDEGRIRYKSYIYNNGKELDEESFLRSLVIASEMWKQYGNGIVEIVGNSQSVPKDIIQGIEEEIMEKSPEE